MIKGAIFSEDKKYRYVLWRFWNTKLKCVLFIGLNPSAADETYDDNTIRVCTSYAKKWGYGGLFMCNLFAYVSTDPNGMLGSQFPEGALNNAALELFSYFSEYTICAWGTMGGHRNKDKEIFGLLKNPRCLQLTKEDYPHHPLRLGGNVKPIIYGGR